MKVSVKLLFFVVFAGSVSVSSVAGQSAPQDRATVRTIVIDPGHGGKDPGTIHGKTQEKAITLRVATLLGELIRKNLPDVTVVHTRTKDVYVGLAERGNIANRNHADLFLSIHVDAIKNTGVNGNATFVMGMDKSQANLDVAMRENDVVSLEEDYTTKYEGYVPGSAESFIIFSLMQYAYQGQSMHFAQVVQKHYKLNTTITDRGARMAPYLVLWRTAMPAVLTEIGFLSNEKDRRFVTSDAGQRKIARALFNAFSEYKSRVEGLPKTVLLDDSDGSERVETSSLSVAAATTSGGSGAGGTQSATTASATQDASAKSGITFAVQIRTSYTPINLRDKSFGAYRGKVTEKKIGKLYKYFVGEGPSYQQTLKLQSEVRKSVKDAFMVAFRNGSPIPVAEARKLTNQ